VEETVHIEISMENWKRINKIREDYQYARAQDGKLPEMTTNDVITELTHGRY
jgi:hypothetical protein